MKPKVKEYGLSTLKGLIGAIPFAGTFLNEVSFEARSRLKQERVNSFIEEFGEFIANHNKFESNFDNINSDQIGDVFEEIINSVSKTSAEHKKEIFKKILFKQLISTEINADTTIRFVNITNEISSLQYQILLAFNSLSDNILKYKVQILKLEEEAKKIKSDFALQQHQMITSPEKIIERLKIIPRLIKSKKMALKKGHVNPNYHTTFNVERAVYIAEMQDLIAKGLIFDFIIKTKIIEPYVHFGITEYGRSYMKYIAL